MKATCGDRLVSRHGFIPVPIRLRLRRIIGVGSDRKCKIALGRTSIGEKHRRYRTVLHTGYPRHGCWPTRIMPEIEPICAVAIFCREWYRWRVIHQDIPLRVVNPTLPFSRHTEDWFLVTRNRRTPGG